jgi:hypothetical protein
MSNENQAIQQYAADVVEYARQYQGLDDRGPLPLRDVASTDKQAQQLIADFQDLSEIDGFLEKLNVEIQSAETNYKQALANSTIASLDKHNHEFNAAANPDLNEAITDYIMETTRDEVTEISAYEDGTPCIRVNSSSLDIGLKTKREINSALQQNWQDAGINYHAGSANKGAKFAAKALRAQVMLHNKMGGMGK